MSYWSGAIEDLQDERDALKKHNAELLDRLTVCGKGYNDICNKYADSCAKVSDLEAQLRTANRHLLTAIEQRDEAQTRYTEADEHAYQLRATVAKQATEITALRAALDEANERADHFCKRALVPDGTESRKRITELESVLAETNWFPEHFVAQLQQQLAQQATTIQILGEALEAVDSTLCPCRVSPVSKNCNCDIHAAHRIIAETRAQLPKETPAPPK